METNRVAFIADKLKIASGSFEYSVIKMLVEEYDKEVEIELCETLDQLKMLRDEVDHKTRLIDEGKGRVDFLLKELLEMREKFDFHKNCNDGLRNENFTLVQQTNYVRMELRTLSNENCNLKDSLTRALANRDMMRMNYLAALNALRDAQGPKLFQDAIEACNAQIEKLTCILTACVGICESSPPMAQIALPASPAEPESPKSCGWEIEKVERKNSDLSEDNLRLRQGFVELTQEVGAYLRQHAELTELLSEDFGEELDRFVDKSIASYNSEMQAELKALRKDYEELQNKNEELDEENDKLDETLEECDEKQRELTEQIQTLELQLIAERERCEELEKRSELADALRAELDKERAAGLWVRTQHETEIKGYCERVEFFQAQAERAEEVARKQCKTDICNLQKQVEDLKTRNEKLDKDNKYYLAGFKAHRKELRKELADFAAECNRRVDTVNEEIKKTKARFHDTYDQFNQVIHTTQTHVERSDEVHKRQCIHIQRLMEELECFKNGSKRERDEFAATKKIYESQIQALESKIGAWTEIEGRYGGIENLAAKLAGFYKTSRDQVQILEERKAQIDQLQRERDELLLTQQVYESRIITLESQLKVWKEMHKGRDGVEQLAAKLANYYEISRNKFQIVDDQKAQIKKLRRERDELAAAQKESEAQIAELRSKVEVWRVVEERHNDVEPLAIQVAEGYTSAAAGLALMAEQKAEIARLGGEVEVLRADLDAAKNFASKRQAENMKLVQVKAQEEAKLLAIIADLQQGKNRRRRGQVLKEVHLKDLPREKLERIRDQVLEAKDMTEAQEAMSSDGFEFAADSQQLIVVADLRNFALDPEAQAAALERLHED